MWGAVCPNPSTHRQHPACQDAPSIPSSFKTLTLPFCCARFPPSSSSVTPSSQAPRPCSRTFLARHSFSLPGSEAPFPELVCVAAASTARQQGAVPQAQPVPGTAVPWPRDKQPRPGNELPQFFLPDVL